jgi:hypothetical protein
MRVVVLVTGAGVDRRLVMMVTTNLEVTHVGCLRSGCLLRYWLAVKLMVPQATPSPNLLLRVLIWAPQVLDNEARRKVAWK